MKKDITERNERGIRVSDSLTSHMGWPSLRSAHFCSTEKIKAADVAKRVFV